MTAGVTHIVIVGGGSAGWLTAGVLAADHHHRGLKVTLIESPDVPIIGVGEGTWPSMRSTLQKIGISEDALIHDCNASFKQGTQFVGWSNSQEHTYFHPFSLPIEYTALNPAQYWTHLDNKPPFADFVTPQAAVMQAGLAPKQAATPEYAFAQNYAYHFDAAKFAQLLKSHVVGQLGVQHILANVEQVLGESNSNGVKRIAALQLDNGANIEAGLFVDCSGQKSILLAGHFGVGFESVEDVLFNNSAMATQVPYIESQAPVVPYTKATATKWGWIWDIGLQNRRGIGYVYSDKYVDVDEVQTEFSQYLATQSELSQQPTDFRELKFHPGYRKTFWVENCVAIGLSSGFVEPLEASALALVEQSAHLLSRELPQDTKLLPIAAKRFNSKMSYHWQRIVEFLKLHYAVCQRNDSPYWQAHHDENTWPDSLREKVQIWQQQTPYFDDAPQVDELFPSASYQFVLYGLGFEQTYFSGPADVQRRAAVDHALAEVKQLAQRLCQGLPMHRELLNQINNRHLARQ